ncbi:MAG: hypothetical protein IKC50_08510 [Oscillospiraceae bacterium]|nr:hypothetical protein [Oscillospiraceae bacterium]
MRLPNSMKQERKLRRTAVRFGGLNQSEEARSGELSACENLSSAHFPCLAPRKPRQLFESVTDADDVWSQNGRLVLCRGGKLFCDGKELCDVSPGKKQFAAVNSKLVVWPDKLLIDENTGSVRKMDASVTSVGNDTELTDHTIRMPIPPRIDGGVLQSSLSASGERNGFWFRVYSGLKWDEQNGYTWSKAEWKELADGNALQIGDVLIPTGGDGMWTAQVHATADYKTPPNDADLLSADGVYITVSKISGEGIVYTAGGRRFQIAVAYTLHRCGAEGQDFTSCFRAGDAVSVSGHPISLNNREELFLTEVKEDTLVFPTGSFLPCTSYADVGAFLDGKEPVIGKTSTNVYAFMWQHSGNEHGIRVKGGASDSYIKAKPEQKILIDESGAEAKLWLLEEDETLYELEFSDLAYDKSAHTLLTKRNVYPLTLTVKRAVPEIDYICEKDNRLWGVVNDQNNRVWDKDTEQWVNYKSRLIVASALGMPDDFYDYNGAYSGAYAVAVASEGDFTGICAMDGDVLCWKEDRLHKVLGDYPANYQMTEFHIPGVRAGAHRTLSAQGGTLVYLGRDGVYAYGGGTPRLISAPLGTAAFCSGAAARDGERVLFSLTDETGAGNLFVYDTEHGIWLREDDTQAVFCRHGEALLMLTREGKLLRRDTGTEKVKWQATLTPIRTEFGQRERGAALALRVEMAHGSELAAYTRCDSGPRRLAGRLSGSGTKTLRIEPEPFEQLELCLTGTGDCKVRGLSLLTRAERT